MATKAEKARFNITASSEGYWQGKCPKCDTTIKANDYAVSQAGVIFAIKQHMEKEH